MKTEGEFAFIWILWRAHAGKMQVLSQYEWALSSDFIQVFGSGEIGP